MKLFLRVAVSTLLLAAVASGQDQVPRFEVGPVYSFISIDHAITQQRHGIGMRFTFNVSPWFALDSDFTFTPGSPRNATDVDGGRLTQGQFGPKMGIRRQKWGVFGKARPGFVSFGEAITGNLANPFARGRRTFFAFDIGGVVEFYPHKRMTLRFDLGDTIIHYPPISTPFGPIRSFTTNNTQISTSVLYRF